MDLMSAYLLIVLVLFAGNVALLLGNSKMNNLKLIMVSAALSIVTFILMSASDYLNVSLLDYFGYIFLIVAILVFILIAYGIKNSRIDALLYPILVIFMVLTVLISSQAEMDFFSTVLYSLFVFVILFVVYQLTKLLHHAKRQYSVIIAEYMCLASILIFIFALTYYSTITLDYTAFTPFLILTPTYQLIYVVIGIVVVLVAGVLINDYRGK